MEDLCWGGNWFGREGSPANLTLVVSGRRPTNAYGAEFWQPVHHRRTKILFSRNILKHSLSQLILSNYLLRL